MNRAAGAARGVVHGPVVLDVARLLQPGAPYKASCTTAEHGTKRQRRDAGPHSVEERATLHGARHIGLEHVEIMLYSENLVATERNWDSERSGDESAVIDIDQLVTEFELQSGLQRQATEAGDMAAGGGGVLLRPATIDEAAKARIGGGMLSGVSSLYLSAYCGPVLEDDNSMDLARAGRSQLQANGDSAISAAQAAARARRCRYARLVSCQLWCVGTMPAFRQCQAFADALPFTLFTCLWCAPFSLPLFPSLCSPRGLAQVQTHEHAACAAPALFALAERCADVAANFAGAVATFARRQNQRRRQGEQQQQRRRRSVEAGAA